MTSFRASFGNGRPDQLCAKCSYYSPHESLLANPRLYNYKVSENVWRRAAGPTRDP
jgi:hypothetical protein